MLARRKLAPQGRGEASFLIAVISISMSRIWSASLGRCGGSVLYPENAGINSINATVGSVSPSRMACIPKQQFRAWRFAWQCMETPAPNRACCGPHRNSPQPVHLAPRRIPVSTLESLSRWLPCCATYFELGEFIFYKHG